MNNKKINVDLDTFRYLYIRHKEYLLPVGVIIVCLVLFIMVIIPQIGNLFSLQREYQAESESLNVLKSNLNFLSSLDESTVNSQLKIVSNALPSEKDFAGILNAISYVANVSGVSVGEFEFQVGDLSKKEMKGGIKSFPSLEIAININGGVRGASAFVATLNKTLPLAEVTNINVTGDTSSVKIVFYYKPFPPVGFNDTVPISQLSGNSLSLIKELSSWGNGTTAQPVLPTLPASSSATSPF